MATVACLVSSHLRRPILGASGRHAVVPRTPVEEAAVDEDAEPKRRDDNVGLARQVGRVAVDAPSVAEHSADHQQQANGKNVDGALSADGTHVVFGSLATNLVAGDTNNQQDVFVHVPARTRSTPATPTTVMASARPRPSMGPRLASCGQWRTQCPRSSATV